MHARCLRNTGELPKSEGRRLKNMSRKISSRVSRKIDKTTSTKSNKSFYLPSTNEVMHDVNKFSLTSFLVKYVVDAIATLTKQFKIQVAPSIEENKIEHTSSPVEQSNIFTLC